MTKEADVPTLFFLQAFEQLCSKYDQTYEPTASFPKAPKSKPLPKKKEMNEARLCTFQSKVADIRLKKERVQIEEARMKVQENITKQIEEFKMASEETERDVSDAFKRQKVARSDVPLYLRNEQKDEEAQKWKAKKSRAPMNMPQIRKEFTERLKRSEEVGKNRAINRRERLAASIKESNAARKTMTGKPQKKKQQNYYAVSETESSAKGYYEDY